VLAFPGAEGFGRYTTGGRGGDIVHVTNLNDAGKGSLRDAVSKPNRIVIFDVSGIINLKSVLVFSKNLTVAGETAPGEGVVLYGNRVSFSGANNLICRYLRIRMGTQGSDGKDAAGVADGANMIFDHLSVTWGRDENFSINSTTSYNITIQNSIIGQGLQNHSCGGLIQTGIQHGITLFRNLYIDNKTRNPKVKGLNQFVDNVIYDWGDGAAYNMSGDSKEQSLTDIENNYFIVGPIEHNWKNDGKGNIIDSKVMPAKPFIGGNNLFCTYCHGNFL
jgi:pectate lyase